jgi:aspartate/methionine/tyrosine aminotransferase
MEYEEPKFFHVMQYAAAADRDVIDMVSGNPDWEPPTALREALREYADLPTDAFQYPPSEGLLELREAIGERRNVDPDRVIITNGTGEANYLAMARAFARDAGSEALLMDPVYPYYPGKVNMLGGESTLVPTERDGGLDVGAIREAASADTTLIVLNTPNNPTGAVYDLDAVREVVAVADEVDALVMVDEVYDHFDLTGEFESAMTLDSDRVIVTTGFSKSMAITGFRVGYGIFPDDHVDDAKTRHMLVNVAGARPSQYAVQHALAETPPEYYADARDMLTERADAFTDALDAAGAEYNRPEGAFYVLARFEGFPGTMANVKRLVDEAGVAGMPGEAFGTARDEWIRFALVTPRAVEAADRLADYFAD